MRDDLKAQHAAHAEAQRAIIEREMEEARARIGPPPPPTDAKSRKKRAKQIKDAVVDQRRLRSSDRSETTIAFRGSHALKRQLDALKQDMRASGREKFNEWMERAIEAALDAEGKGRRENGHAVEA